MKNEIRDAIEYVQAKLGNEIKSERELQSQFLDYVIVPYLKERIGLLAHYVPITEERTILRGRYDVRIGSLLIEFEPVMKGITKGIIQAKQYISEFRERGDSVRCFVTDGVDAVFVDENGNTGKIAPLIDKAEELQIYIHANSQTPIEPEDLLVVVSPKSPMVRGHIKTLYGILKRDKDLPFVEECLKL